MSPSQQTFLKPPLAACRTACRALIAAAVLAGPALPLHAQNRPQPAAFDPIRHEGYIEPPEPLRSLVDAPRNLNVSYDNPNPGSRRYFLRPLSDILPPLERLGAPWYNFGTWAIDSRANRAREMTVESLDGIELFDWAARRTIAVQLPAGARAFGPSWSPDGTRLAYFATFDDATHIYLADPATGKSRPLTRTSVLATNVTSFQWTADSRAIITVLVPAGRGAEPKPPAVATEPMVRVNEKNNQLSTRTFSSQLEWPYQKDLVEYHMTGQLAVIDVRSRGVRKVGAPGMISSLDVSPDGSYVHVTYLHLFRGTHELLLDGNGKIVSELAAPRAAQGAPQPNLSRRATTWHPFESGQLFLQLTRDDADTSRFADRLVHLPDLRDTTAVRVVYETANRIVAVRFSDNGRILFITETSPATTRDSAQATTSEIAVLLDEDGRAFTISSGTGAAPRGRRAADGIGVGGGPFVNSSRGDGFVMVSSDGRHIFAQGTAPTASDSTQERPYIDRVEIRTGARERIYHSTSPLPEKIVMPLDDDFQRALINRGGFRHTAQQYILDRRTGVVRQITENRDFFAALEGMKSRTLYAKRADGMPIRVIVKLPAGYVEGTKLPALFFVYPSTYKSGDAYAPRIHALAAEDSAAAREGRGSVWTTTPTYNPYEMAFVTSMGYALVTHGVPIIGTPGREPNDNYVRDLRENFRAVITMLDTLNLIDRDRLGIYGHSYGAFASANALVHTPFFKAGIACDGNYNRTLTPTGFQGEHRDLWTATEAYLEGSPILYADQMTGALLLCHGLEDQNPGTHPDHSRHLFHALHGLGKNVALYMYPYEDHYPVARETVLDQWARWIAWLDKYVRNHRAGDVAPEGSR